MVPVVGLGQGGEPSGGRPVEAAAVDDHPTDGHPVAAEELGHRVGDDVGSVFDGSQQIRGGERGVDC
ncbi:MAG: hypothetical protein MKZ66_00795 [Acidimicrobiales bacterium]|nr:hypothetical protein [Acidimicrobiales bacterium]